MADDTEQEPPLQSSGGLQPTGRDISRRSVVVGLIGLVAAEAVAGGVTWQALSQGIHKIVLAFAPPVSTPTSLRLGATLYIYRRHTGPVSAVEWSPNGKRIVSGSDDQTAQVWDASTGGHILTYRGHSDMVLAVAWSSDGRYIASGGGPSTLTVSPTNVGSTDSTCSFDSANNVWTCTVTLTEDANSQGNLNWSANTNLGGVSFSPASGTLSPGTSQDVGITIPASSCTNGMFNFAVRGGNAVAVSWTCTPPTQSPPTPPQCPPGFVRQGGECVPLPPPQCAPGFVRQGGECVPPPPDTTVQVWDATTGGKVLTYRGHKAGVTAVVWSPDGTRIASGSGDATVQVWDATTGGKVLTYRDHKAGVTAVVWSPDGTRIASGSADKTVQMWNATDGSHAFTYHGHSDLVYGVAWSPDGTRIASGSADKTVQVWDATDGGHAFTYRGHSDFVNAVAWSPDGKRMASGSYDGTVQVWDAVDGGHAFTYHGHPTVVTAVVWSPDGRRIASGSRDTTVQIWEAV